VTRREWTAAVVVAMGVFLGSWSLLHHGFLGRDQITDITTYVRFGNAVKFGDKVPYRDFRLEYPPASLPVLLPPTIRMQSRKDDFGYRHWFDREMAVCGCLALLGTALCLRALGAGRRRTIAALGLFAVSPLLLGSVILTRFDLWPAALAVLALAAVLSRRPAVSAVLLGVAIGAKLWPAVIFPLALVFIARNEGRRAAAVWTGVVTAVLAAIFVPFAVIAPAGFRHSFYLQFARPLQIESLGSAALLVGHHLVGTTAHSTSGFGSQNLTGPGAEAAALATSIAGVLALLAVWALFIRGPATAERLVTHVAAAIAVLLAFGKVFSPQFMVWLVPFVVLVGGARGIAANALLVAGLVLTQSWFPRSYWALSKHLAGTQVAEVLARDLVVVALAFVLAWPRSEHEVLGKHRSRLEALERVRAQVE
jgi:uncharacterized membrane protein